MVTDRRALYNLLRMNWLRDPSIAVEPWQVADYRAMPLEALFQQLRDASLPMDRVGFQSLADEFDSPEELADQLTMETANTAADQDKIYLIIFELWRRLIPEKLCLSIFCDELDHQIDLFDNDKIDNPEELQDVLANLAVILDENTDHGEDPKEVFESISSRCANDLESFLYDFIAEQIDESNESYAAELIDDFYPYISDAKWFEFLKIRLISSVNMAKANLLIRQLMYQITEPDPQFNLEVLSFLVQGGDRELFTALVKHTLPQLTVEEEFKELLVICADYFQRLDLDSKESAVRNILSKRSHTPLEQPINPNIPQAQELIQILE